MHSKKQLAANVPSLGGVLTYLKIIIHHLQLTCLIAAC